MENQWLYIWSETIPNWAMALSALSAAMVFVWRRQDRREQRELRESDITQGVNAVWVIARMEPEGEPKWGILVTNSLRAPVTGLRVACSGNHGAQELVHSNLQPGKHFFESLGQGHPRPWALPTNNISSFEFISASKKHQTSDISFTYAGKPYTTNPVHSAREV
ncbi:hypothetical protein [Mycetocola spongiae]|uniref:hypothetical protein n=1 Tax=Mycetocola spongiae TaxID=2859226 RepID=UPI001CF3B031|nr:hypothetical protein [Mycetocola spongiae]UCR89162.1 hypothetical protein KXZ72_00125 [Mycetocola spongiae]